MKKIFAFVGSQKGKKSNTVYLINRLLEELISSDMIDCEIVTSKDYDLMFCDGCEFCFSNGFCTKKQKDDLNLLEKKILEADFFILGSPIYVHNISASTKLVIDRLAIWGHLMTLMGKPVMVVTSNDSNGHGTGTNYLRECLTQMGGNVVASLNASLGFPEQLFNEEWLVNSIGLYSGIINKSLEQGPSSNSNLEKVFNANKEMYEFSKKIGIENKKYDLWIKAKLESCSSYSELINKYWRNYHEQNTGC